MASYNDIDTPVRINGALTVNSFTIDAVSGAIKTTGQISGGTLVGDGSGITNLSSSAMTDVLKLDGSRAMTGNLNISGSITTGSFIASTNTYFNIRAKLGGQVGFTNSSGTAWGIMFDDSNNSISAYGNITATGKIVTAGTINATSSLQENGTNLSAKYALQATTITAGSGLVGGGDLSVGRTFAINYGGNGTAATISRSDHSHTNYTIGTSMSYASVVGDDALDGWYTLFAVSDASTTPILCNIKAYAHTSASFVVSKGYNTNNGIISVINANTTSTNPGYKYIKGIRMLGDGSVQMKLSSGGSVSIQAQLLGNGALPSLSATLTKDTSTPTVLFTIDPLPNGSMVTSGDFYSGINKVWHTGSFDPTTKADKATLISAGSGLIGGGDLSANRTLSVDFGSGGTQAASGNHLHTGTYLPLSGGPSNVLTGSLYMNNNLSIYMKNSTGASQQMFILTSSNTFTIGNNGIPMTIASNVDPKVNVAGLVSTLYHDGNLFPMSSTGGVFNGNVSFSSGLNLSLLSGNITVTSGNVSATTINAISNLQENGTNLSAKYLALTGGTVSGTLSLPSGTSIGTTTSTELGYVHNVTSPIQTQIDTKTTPIYIQSRGQNLVTNGTGLLANNTNFSSFTYDGSDSYFSKGSFKSSTYNVVIQSDELIPVDVNSIYKMSLSAKSNPHSVGAHAYFGIAEYDADGLSIIGDHHMYIANTTTTLSTALNNGDTVVNLASAANWNNSVGTNTYQRKLIFWDWTNASGYLFPPNTYSRHLSINNLWADGSINYSSNTITLSAPWSGGIVPSGTSVSQGSSGGTYKYCVLANVDIPGTWTVYSGTIGGVDNTGNNDSVKFSWGTANIKLLFLLNRDVSGNTTWVSNLSFGINYASVNYVDAANALKANLAGPTTFTGTIALPTTTTINGNPILHAGNLATGNILFNNTAGQSVNGNFTVLGDGDLWVGSTVSGGSTGGGQVVVRDTAGVNRIQFGGTILTNINSFIDVSGNGQFTGNLSANTISVGSTALIPNLNAFQLNSLTEDNFAKVASIYELGGWGVLSGLGVVAQAVPNMTVLVSGGTVYTNSGKRVVVAQANQAMNAPSATYNRIDSVYIQGSSAGANEGKIGYMAGTAQASPVAPTIPTDAVILANITVRQNTGSILSTDVVDARVYKDIYYDGTTNIVITSGNTLKVDTITSTTLPSIAITKPIKGTSWVLSYIMPTGNTSYVWNHNLNLANYAVTFGSNSPNRHISWIGKSGNSVIINIGDVSDIPITIDAVITAY